MSGSSDPSSWASGRPEARPDRSTGSTGSAGGPTVVTEPASDLIIMWGGLPLAGAAAGWLVAALASWATEDRWVPFGALFRLVDRLPEPWALLGPVALGTLVGFGAALVGTAERLTVTVDRDTVTLTRDGRSTRHARAGIEAAFLDGGRFVLLGPDGTELARERTDLRADRLARAFTTHGYRWTDADPHAGAYRRWVPGGAPDLPAGADAVLRARQRALDKGHAGDVAEFRSELARLGIVVREERKRQYWRPSRP